MDGNILTNTMTLAQLCDQLDRKDLTVNREYQRSDEVWPVFARSMLVETVLLGYPIPKITIRQKTDMRSLKTSQEIVDGQQRIRALYDFYRGSYALATNLESEEFRGLTIHNLSDGDKSRFVTYPIGADILVGATDDEVIEVFRRMNSYTAPLNPEEQRHAAYQGKFKWFVFDMRKPCEGMFANLGVFSKKSFVRMQDAKLITEVCHALIFGITTTSKKTLENLYAKFDKSFANEDEIRNKLLQALELIQSIQLIAGSPLTKPYNFYSLWLAVLHALSPLETLTPSLDGLHQRGLTTSENVFDNLSNLSEALADPDGVGRHFNEFVNAASEKTNVRGQREIRFRWFYSALTDQMI